MPPNCDTGLGVEAHEHELEAGEFVDSGLEHLLLVVGLAEQESGDLAGHGVGFDAACLCFDGKATLRWDLSRHPGTEVHWP